MIKSKRKNNQNTLKSYKFCCTHTDVYAQSMKFLYYMCMLHAHKYRCTHIYIWTGFLANWNSDNRKCESQIF